MREMADILEAYAKKTPKSAQMHAAAAQVLQGGVASPFRYFEPYPFFVDHGKAGRIWDVDGNEYIDFNNSYGAIIAGHAHPEIVRAIREQAEKGTMFGIPGEMEQKLIRELLKRYPAMNFFRFCNSGAEATMYAQRTARAFTGKNKVIKIEGSYHGAFDGVLISDKPRWPAQMGPAHAPTPVLESAGILPDTAKNTLVVPWNDPDALEQCLQRNLGEVAALIVEPIVANFGMCLPEKGYLEQVREITRRHNVVLIFDEVKVGVRVAPGGAVQVTGVTPDVVCLAKAFGGGMPIASIGATEPFWSLFSPLGDTVQCGTYNANPISIAASLACLTKVLTADAYKHMERLGAKLKKGMEESIRRYGVRAVVNGIGGMWTVYFLDKVPKNYRDTLTLDKNMFRKWYMGLLVRGLNYSAPNAYEQTFISVGNTEKDIDEALERIDASFKELK